MNFNIAFSDIDGTLLNAEREPSPLLIEEVGHLSAAGVPFVLISSRPPRAMRWIQEVLGVADRPLVAYNGGLVLVDGRPVHDCAIPLDIVRHVELLNREMGLSVQLFNGEEWYVERMDHYARREEHNTRISPVMRSNDAVIVDWNKRGLGAHKIMVMGDPAGLDRLTAALADDYAAELHLYRSKDDYLEIANKAVDKLVGVRAVLTAKFPDLTLADCVAFGDNFNDETMLRGVGCGVAVANARPQVQGVADQIAGAGKADGVAIWLRSQRPS